MFNEETKTQKSNIGDVIDFILLKRVIQFAIPYRFYFFVAAISALLLC